MEYNKRLGAEWYLEDLKTKFAKINPEEYYLSYSGGRDSHFLLWFIRDYAKIEGIEVVGFNTYMEHPEILNRMRKYADIIMIPKMKPHEIIEKYGSPTFSKWQDEMISRYQNGSRSENTMGAITGEGRTVYKISKTAKELLFGGSLHKISNKCCDILKKNVAKVYEKQSKRKAILGVRSSESDMRKQMYKSCFTKDMIFTPIHDLTDSLLEEIESLYNIDVPKIYEHISRTGCMGCPYGRQSGNLETELSLMNENRKSYILSIFGDSYNATGTTVNNGRKNVKNKLKINEQTVDK